MQSIEPFTEYSINVDIENEANCYITEENKFEVPEIKIPQEVLDKLAKEISEQQLKQN